MLSGMLQLVNIRDVFRCFHLTRFPFTAQMATRLLKSRACFLTVEIGCGKICNTAVQKRLTLQIVAPTMQTLTCTYVLVDNKSEQAEEGARSFLLLWLV
jgi:hypothetical protein